MDKTLISIVIPVFNEGNQIVKNLLEVKTFLDYNKFSFEIIVVDDGSRDNTWPNLIELSEKEKDVKLIKLSRNFGKESAIFAGLDASSGEACIVMDGDLQHPPQYIADMIKLWREDGYEVVEAVKESRGKEGILNKIGARMFYYFLGKFSGFELKDASDFKLLDRRVLDALLSLEERQTFFRGMSAWVGFKRATIKFIVAERSGGTTKWPKIALVKLAINAISSFSSVPLQVVTCLGAVFFLGAVGMAFQTIYNKLFGYAVSGFTTVILLQLIIGSCIMISLGIIGIYISKIYNEVKMRPRHIVSRRINFDREN